MVTGFDNGTNQTSKQRKPQMLNKFLNILGKGFDHNILFQLCFQILFDP